MKKIVLSILTFTFLFQVSNAQKEGEFKTYKLKNGLTVALDQDPTQTMAFGVIAVNAGSQDEELNATGMAHYLEHMLFKGTQTLGTSSWEKEKPFIDEIIKLYDELQTANTDEEIKEVYKKINETSQKASKYAIPNEFSKLIQQMGGVALNASTSYDFTNYFNAFPPNQLGQWLDLYAHRFQKPVFRLFQTELEAVYEEKNRAEDNPNNAYFNAMRKSIYGEHPYGRPIIGLTKHLKKPWMSKMIEFFEKWYVPSNMVLILSGNFDMEKAEQLIAEKFGAWETKEVPNRNYSKVEPFEGKVTKKVRLTDFLRGEMIYKGVKDNNSKEILALDVAAEMLSNSAQTGILDKLYLDGEVMFVGANHSESKGGTTFQISYAPVFDANQRRQLSFSSAEKAIERSVKSLKNGTYKYWLLDQVKANMIKDYKLMMEQPSQRALALQNCFILGKKFERLFDFEEQLKQITKDDVSNAVKKYIGNDYLAFYSSKGKAKKEKVKKPSFDPVQSQEHQPSVYAQKFTKIPVTSAEHHFTDIKNDVKVMPFQDKINLFYVKNKRNDIFSMEVIFHVGTHKLPKLQYGTTLMNSAGIMGQYKSDEFRKEIGKLGLTYQFSVNQDYTILSLQGREEKLAEACQLISRLMLLPKIEEKALDRIMGQEYYRRMAEKKRANLQANALRQYILYGDKSNAIDRLPMSELLAMSPTDLTGDFIRAMSYNADIHYYGKLSVGQVRYILKKNLAFGANRIQGTSPELKPKKKYTENTIFLARNKDATQSQIFFYIAGKPISLERRPVIRAFNQYFGGGFNGLMMKEVREQRSLAYSAGASVGLPLIPTWDSYLNGSIGTQADKTVESVKVVTDLLNNMPEYKDRMGGVKNYLLNSSYLTRPSDRNLSYNIYNWILAGYKEDPTKFNLPYYQKMTFEDILNYYKQELKGKPYVIGIVGNTGKIDEKELAKYGKVKKIDVKKLFSKK